MPVGKLYMYTIDCDDPGEVSAFWSKALGLEETYSSDEAVMLSNGQTSIGWGKIDEYHPPAWPDTEAPKRFHLDIAVADIEEAEKELLGLGATKPEFQPGEGKWTVLLDPAGHPFCIFVA